MLIKLQNFRQVRQIYVLHEYGWGKGKRGRQGEAGSESVH